jgi:DNA-binding transcriptional LysR family regulator
VNTDQLHLFLAVARHRSLSRAAVALDLGQATVSDRLHALEAEVGTPLFARQGRGVSLSAAGEAFLPYAERALDVLRQAKDSARAATAGQRGSVTVAVTVTSGAYLFAPALVAFQAAYPGVEVRVRSVHSWDAPGLILDGVAQLALISGPSVHPQIESLAGWRGRMVLAAGARHPLAAAAEVSVEQLARQQWLVSYWGPASQVFLDSIRAAGRDPDKIPDKTVRPDKIVRGPGHDIQDPSTPSAGQALRPASSTGEGQAGAWMELSPVELVKGMLLAGTGISLLPEIAVQRELASGELVALPLKTSPTGDRGTGRLRRLPPWEITLIRRKRQPPNAAAAALAETLKERLPGLMK